MSYRLLHCPEDVLWSVTVTLFLATTNGDWRKIGIGGLFALTPA
jgi:hypothetical protein